ncbi:MAG: hypothetical protein J0I97_01540 [Microbacterium sp.]|uniref:DUF6510 family protein n=1 Tax=Microbacterium sp. TaxID=51671 RepID=UPI001AC0A7E4|nr:DUF6510 family protein [Microbacterium sp.]MBN9152630.1 hypothetical protein [Microbacterium sp.]MBN9184137.1 hypothetical protein [Microbacterium sp.]MBN9190447.1 hypothetical protein [Microbacterium sp.]
MGDAREHTATTLDGNALAGLLGDVFAVDVTMIVTECRGCGRSEPLAEAIVERDASCAIVRCRGCTRTQFTVFDEREGIRIDLGSIGLLRLERP